LGNFFPETQAERGAALYSKSAQAAAKKTGNPKLAALATAARLDPFTRVKKAIDDMVEGLLEEAKEEVKQKDWCVDELAKNERQTNKQTHTKGSLETKIEGLEMSIDNLNGTIQTLKEEISDLEASKVKAKEDREAEAAEYKLVVADQQKTQALLMEATEVLKSVYAAEAEAGAALLQKRQTPPVEFETYEKRGEAPGVITLLEHIIEGSKAMEAEAVKDEQAAQDEYMKFKQSTQDAIAAKESAVIDRRTELSAMKEDLLQAKSELDGTITELETLANNKAGLHQSCDFLLKNFDVRAEARDQEVAALREAKAFLSGMQS
jgi:chromosome segregation ATPase